MKMVPVQLEGDVQLETVAVGSKSERTAVTLRTGDGETYVLQSQDGPPFDVDDALQPMVGHRIRASGIAADQTLIVRDWNFVE
jgi:hypothetical protein